VHNPIGFGFGFTLKVVQGKPKQMVVDEKLTWVLGFAIMTSKKVRDHEVSYSHGLKRKPPFKLSPKYVIFISTSLFIRVGVVWFLGFQQTTMI
jgi:hypothetical protein